MRIVILGNSGSGKSTLARRLGNDLGIPHFHMDRLHWKPGWQASTEEELHAKVVEVVQVPDWIIDGNYSRATHFHERLSRADIALVLEIPVLLSLLRVGKRWLTYIGRTRPDMGAGCREKWTIDWEFFRWIITWPQRKHRTYARLAEYPHLDVRVLDQHYKYAELLASLRQLKAAERVTAAPRLRDQEH